MNKDQLRSTLKNKLDTVTDSELEIARDNWKKNIDLKFPKDSNSKNHNFNNWFISFAVAAVVALTIINPSNFNFFNANKKTTSLLPRTTTESSLAIDDIITNASIELNADIDNEGMNEESYY